MLATLRAVRVLQEGHRDMEDYGSQTDLRMNRLETEKMTGHLAETKDGHLAETSTAVHQTLSLTDERTGI